MTEQKPQTHSSHIDTFESCQWLDYLVNFEGLRRPPGFALVVGGATHEPIEADMNNKKDKGELLTREEIMDIARDAVTHRWEKEGCRLVAEEKEKGNDKMKAEAVGLAISLADLHHEQLAPTIEPLHVEEPWVLELQGYPVDLAGRIDLQEKNGRLRDTKTSAKSPTAGQTDSMNQLTVYSLAAWKIPKFGGKIPELAVDYLIKTKTPKSVTEYTTRTKGHFERLLRRLEIMIRVREAGNWYPTGRKTWKCCEKWCGFYPCKYAI